MQRFRAMVWPGSLPPVESVHAVGPYRLDGDLLKLDLDEASVRTLDIPDELYLRQLDELDLEDPSAILNFTNTYGRLGHLQPSPVRDQPPSLPGISRRLRLLEVPVPDETELDWEAWRHEVTNHPSMDRWGPVEAGLMISDGMQHIEAFRAWAQAFRILTDTYHRYLGHIANEDDLLNLTIILTELLDPFSPTIQIRHNVDLGQPFDPFEDTYPRLENILALQMYRHIATEDAYKQCQNDNCGRLFVHQTGRSQSGQSRSVGVKYCTDKCARAQGARDRRRRDKEQDTN